MITSKSNHKKKTNNKNTHRLSAASIFILLAVLAAALLSSSMLAACGASKSPERHTYHMIGSFDTVITIMGYADSKKEFQEYADLAEARFKELHQYFDRYNTYENVANIFIINQMAGEKPVKVEQEIIDLLQTSVRWQQESSGAVNIAMGSVLEIWHDTRTMALGDPKSASLPDPEKLKQAAQHTDINDLVINQEDMTVFIKDPEMQLDLGAIAKGYATELVARELLDSGWSTFVISSGGNVRTADAPLLEDRPYWRIGIQDPLEALQGEEETLIYTVRVKNQSVVTSGDYQRYFTYEGKRYHHIVDPATLMPADEFSSVTVVTPDSGLADFYSTEFFILPYEQGRKYAASLDNVEVMWVFKDGTVKMTEGMTQIADKSE